MKIGVVDIGSNAIRLLICKLVETSDEIIVKRLEFIRFPLRLGEDVFQSMMISETKSNQLHTFLKLSKLFFELHDVDNHIICATSAMRDSINSYPIILKAKRELGFEIKILSGIEEAEITNLAITTSLKFGNFLHIDVGGGSSELTFYEDKIPIGSKSFNIGTVRATSSNSAEYKLAINWLNQFNYLKNVKAICTGGNIVKITELIYGYPINTIKNKLITIHQLNTIISELINESCINRSIKFNISMDRSEVIVTAGLIYRDFIDKIQISEVLVPDLGLKDGLLIYLYKNLKSSSKLFKFEINY